MGNVSTCLWFDGQAEEAARFYTSLVKNSRVGDIVPYGEAGPGEKGSVMIVTFELDGQKFIGLNGGPEFKFDEAISIHITCDSQQEIDELWDQFTADGGRRAMRVAERQVRPVVADRLPRAARDDHLPRPGGCDPGDQGDVRHEETGRPGTARRL